MEKTSKYNETFEMIFSRLYKIKDHLEEKKYFEAGFDLAFLINTISFIVQKSDVKQSEELENEKLIKEMDILVKESEERLKFIMETQKK